MRKSLGSKRSLISEDDIKLITRTFINFEVVDETNFEQLSLENIPEQKSIIATPLPSLKLKYRKHTLAKSLIIPILAIVV